MRLIDWRDSAVDTDKDFAVEDEPCDADAGAEPSKAARKLQDIRELEMGAGARDADGRELLLGGLDTVGCRPDSAWMTRRKSC